MTRYNVDMFHMNIEADSPEAAVIEFMRQAARAELEICVCEDDDGPVDEAPGYSFNVADVPELQLPTDILIGGLYYAIEDLDDILRSGDAETQRAKGDTLRSHLEYARSFQTDDRHHLDQVIRDGEESLRLLAELHDDGDTPPEPTDDSVTA